MLNKDESMLQNFNDAIQHEWLETNGLGGWASSSVIGCNTRRYHGLLVAATVPPAERMALVSKLDETIVMGQARYELGTNLYPNETIHPNGHQYLKSFSKDLFPEWIYEVNGITLKKTVGMVHGENTTLIKYEVADAPEQFTLELQPFLSVRGYHSLMHANDAIHWDAEFENNIFKTKAYDNAPDIFIHIPGGDYHHQPNWYLHFNYAVEKYRGQDFEEDLFTHGHFSIDLKKGDSVSIIISTENPAGRNASELLQKEEKRKRELLKVQPEDETLQQLILAADQFIVKRTIKLAESEVSPLRGDLEGATVIAGYHWFADWGRDTMISLPGLCLSTGRLEDARKILSAFAKSVSMGMLPNRFQDNGEAPEYNNVDGTLWYFVAIHKYLEAGGDKEFVLNELLPVLKDIIEWHHKGTRYHIHDEADGLLYSGEEGVQLTWMDAKVGDWVVTPRTGKAVEVNALWYNALSIYATLLELNKNKKEAKEAMERAAVTKNNFNELFWNKSAGYLYDVIDGDIKDDTFRPNQLFAISLPFALVEDKNAKMILKAVTEKLYTPAGLHSLPADHPNYVGIYGGDALHRDAAYHQGTVWSWLLGAYVDAIMKTQGTGGKEQALQVIENFKYHLNEGCIGSVSEIFDANAPHHPRGCIAQAWGVAEVLRVIKEYKLYSLKNEKVKAKRLAENVM